MVVIYSRRIQEDFLGLFHMMDVIFELLVFLMLITLFFTIIAIKVLPPSPSADEFKSDFSNFGYSFDILWWGLFAEGYPEFMEPSLHESAYTLLFFVPFILLSRFLWQPIPSALLENAYVEARSKKMFKNQLIEREGLFASFYCLHVERYRI